MKQFNPALLSLLLTACVLLAGNCSSPDVKTDPAPEIVLVGSTPGDSLIKSLLTIDPDKLVDFIRWDLTLRPDETFDLNLNFGEAQPNTLGFKGGGEKMSLQGRFTVAESEAGNASSAAIYRLVSDAPAIALSLIRFNDNLFHLLTPDDRLLVGNGGWSYTLNRKDPVPNPSEKLPSLTDPSSLEGSAAPTAVFDGRTPCRELADHYGLPVSDGCFKLKWRLILNRDSLTLQPTTYTLQGGGRRHQGDITGNWTVLNGKAENPHAVIYQLDPEEPEKSLYFLAADENVLLFLTKDHRLFTGNADFSFSLNKR